MAITQTWTTSFKYQILLGEHDLADDVLKMALYTSSALLGADTTVYTTTGETSGTGYTAGGVVLTNVTVSSGNGIAYVNFDNPTWSGTSFTTIGALIYNSTKSNKSIAVINFGQTQSTTNENFVLQMPANNPTFALIRLV